MTEPSSNIPEDIANAEVEEDQSTPQKQPGVDLNIDQEKREAWDRIKSDYETEPGGQPVPNSMDQAQRDVAEAEEGGGDDDGEGDDESRTAQE
jgi:hypothetical protein